MAIISVLLFYAIGTLIDFFLPFFETILIDCLTIYVLVLYWLSTFGFLVLCVFINYYFNLICKFLIHCMHNKEKGIL